MRVELISHLDVHPADLWAYIQKPALLHYLAAPLITFTPISERPQAKWPDRWAIGEYHARMALFGYLPLGVQTIGIEYPPAPQGQYIMRDNGRGGVVSRWDHWITITPDGTGSVYSDRIDVEAGILTPVMAGFARLFYAHRQRRLRLLVKQNFEALAPSDEQPFA